MKSARRQCKLVSRTTTAFWDKLSYSHNYLGMFSANSISVASVVDHTVPLNFQSPTPLGFFSRQALSRMFLHPVDSVCRNRPAFHPSSNLCLTAVILLCPFQGSQSLVRSRGFTKGCCFNSGEFVSSLEPTDFTFQWFSPSTAVHFVTDLPRHFWYTTGLQGPDHRGIGMACMKLLVRSLQISSSQFVQLVICCPFSQGLVHYLVKAGHILSPFSPLYTEHNFLGVTNF